MKFAHEMLIENQALVQGNGSAYQGKYEDLGARSRGPSQ